eukprot:ctg_1755.g500
MHRGGDGRSQRDTTSRATATRQRAAPPAASVVPIRAGAGAGGWLGRPAATPHRDHRVYERVAVARGSAGCRARNSAAGRAATSPQAHHVERAPPPASTWYLWWHRRWRCCDGASPYPPACPAGADRVGERHVATLAAVARAVAGMKKMRVEVERRPADAVALHRPKMHSPVTAAADQTPACPRTPRGVAGRRRDTSVGPVRARGNTPGNTAAPDIPGKCTARHRLHDR